MLVKGVRSQYVEGERRKSVEEEMGQGLGYGGQDKNQGAGKVIKPVTNIGLFVVLLSILWR